jgi:hypothetical protein
MQGLQMSTSEQGRRLKANEDKETRLAVNLPIRIHRQLKVRAAEEGMSIRDYVLSLLRREGIGR